MKSGFTSVSVILIGIAMLFPITTTHVVIGCMPPFIARRIKVDYARGGWGVLQVFGVLWIIGGVFGIISAIKSLVALFYP